MCDPISLTMAASAAVSAAGTVMGGMQANAMGKYQQKIANQNADMAREAARDSIERGKIENRDLGRRVGEVKGQQAAATAANGVEAGYGSADRMAQDTAMMAREDQDALFKNIDQRTRGFDIQAWNSTAQGAADRYRGKQAMIGGFMQGGATLLGGVSQSLQMHQKIKGFGA